MSRCRKIWYSEEGARLAAYSLARRLRSRVAWYRCPECRVWHITRRIKGKKNTISRNTKMGAAFEFVQERSWWQREGAVK